MHLFFFFLIFPFCGLFYKSWFCFIFSSSQTKTDLSKILLSPSSWLDQKLSQMTALRSTSYLGTQVSSKFEHSCCCFFFFPPRAVPMAYGSSQARGVNWSSSCRPTPQPQQCRIWAASLNYTTAHGNARSLTHWEARGWTRVLMDTSQILFHCSTVGTLNPVSFQSIFLPFV